MKVLKKTEEIPGPDWPLDRILERLVKFKMEPVIWNYRLGVFISEFSNNSVNVYYGRENKIYTVGKDECKKYRPSQETIEALAYFYDQIRRGKEGFTTHSFSDDLLEFEEKFGRGLKNTAASQRKMRNILNVLVCAGVLYPPEQIGSGWCNSDIGGRVVYEYSVRRN